jgi:hypothetical protein
MWFGDRVEDAAEFVLGLMGWMLQGLDDAGRDKALDNLHDNLAAHLTAAGVLYDSAAWIIPATRPRTESLGREGRPPLPKIGNRLRADRVRRTSVRQSPRHRARKALP